MNVFPVLIFVSVCCVYQTVDSDGSGKISAIELQQALTNNNWSHFNAETCRLLIGMFDQNRYKCMYTTCTCCAHSVIVRMSYMFSSDF